jgi:diguanylate cyclase (GGDEF)-like protein
MMDLPKIEIPALRAGGTTQRIVVPAGERAGVLIVDDTPAKLVALAAIVSGMALEIVTATSGEQALRQLLKRDFALILLDVNMPTMDGFETAKLIRSRPRSEHTPIIFVTAEANSEAERISGYTLGAVDFIYSPIIPEILRAKVQVFVNLFYLQRQVLLHNEHLESLVAQRTAALTEEIAERKRAEQKVKRLNRIYAVLSGINSTIVRVRVRDRQELFAEACRIAVEHGQFRMAWIGLLDPNGVDITPVARAGFDEGYLDQIRLTARDDVPDSCPLVAQALGGNVPIICNDIGEDARMARWREAALQRGYRSLVVFPLRVGDKMAGLLLLYASEKDFFDVEEMRLLADITGDISFALDYIEKEERLNYLAHYDALTALPNRVLLADRLHQAVIRSQRDGLSVAVAFLDLDGFKQVNDQHGHAVGDTLLITLAERMKAEIREGDTLARIGGDEFVAVLVGLIDENVYVPILDRLLKASSTPVTVDGQVLQVSASIGVTLYPHDDGDADMLLRHADQAMYLAKQAGKNRYHLFDVVQDTAAFAAGMPDAAAKATVNATELKLEEIGPHLIELALK